MLNLLGTLAAFLVALLVLVTVHEWGHYRAAVACKVRVLRFSFGFGPVLWCKTPKRQYPGQQTEFRVSLLPLGGYVQMLGETARASEGLSDEDKRWSFSHKPLWARAFIALAGPLANFVLAALLYAGMNWAGTWQPRAILATPVAGSLAAKAGVRAGDELQVLQDPVTGKPLLGVQSLTQARWKIARLALAGKDVDLLLRRKEGDVWKAITLHLPTGTLKNAPADESLYEAIGIHHPMAPALIREVQTADAQGRPTAAARAGVRAGDVVMSVDGQGVTDVQALLQHIKQDTSQTARPWRVLRKDEQGRQQVLALQVQLDVTQSPQGGKMGRLGARLGGAPAMVKISEAPWTALYTGAHKAWDTLSFTAQQAVQIFTGRVSSDSLGGPVAIASMAGQSAAQGMGAFVLFVAAISVALGAFNLLPVPGLDGGHLLLYALEALRGKPFSAHALIWIDSMGIAALVTLMGYAMFNDIVRLISG